MLLPDPQGGSDAAAHSGLPVAESRFFNVYSHVYVREVTVCMDHWGGCTAKQIILSWCVACVFGSEYDALTRLSQTTESNTRKLCGVHSSHAAPWEVCLQLSPSFATLTEHPPLFSLGYFAAFSSEHAVTI